MTVDTLQLAAVGVAIAGVAGAIARHYMGELGRAIKDLQDRLRIAEAADAAQKADMVSLSHRFDENTRQNAVLVATVASLSNDIRGLMVAVGRLDERLDWKKEMRAMLGRREEDKDTK